MRQFTVDLCCVRGKHRLRKHTHIELQNDNIWAHTWAPNLIHRNPQYLHDVSVSKYHRTQTLFFSGRSVSSLDPPVGIQHQGDSAKLAGKRAPKSSAKLFLRRGTVAQYLPCSLAAPAACDKREENSVRVVELCLLCSNFYVI